MWNATTCCLWDRLDVGVVIPLSLRTLLRWSPRVTHRLRADELGDVRSVPDPLGLEMGRKHCINYKKSRNIPSALNFASKQGLLCSFSRLWSEYTHYATHRPHNYHNARTLSLRYKRPNIIENGCGKVGNYFANESPRLLIVGARKSAEIIWTNQGRPSLNETNIIYGHSTMNDKNESK